MARSSIYPRSVQPGKPRLSHPPVGWSTVSFRDIFEVVERPVCLQDDHDYQLVTAKRSRGGIVPRERLVGKDILTKTQFLVREGDFLMSNRQIIHGGCGIVPPSLDGSLVSNEYTTLRPKEGLAADFLHFLPHTTLFQQTCFHASVGVDVEKMVFDIDQWLSFRINLPPLPEQRRIAEILSSVDEAIAATQAVIEQTRTVKQGVLKRLLTKGIGHTRFKQTEIGEVPETWKVVPLSYVTRSLDAGVSVNSENRTKQKGEIGILKTSSVSYGIFQHEEHKAVLAEETCRVRTPVKANRIIISRMNTPALVGASVYVPRDFPDLFLPDRLWQLEIKDHRLVQVKWLSQCLAYEQTRERIREMATGTSGSMKNIPKSRLLDMLIPFPPFAEQERYAQIISEFEQQEIIGVQERDRLNAVKRALTSDLLTGRKRVPVAQLAAAE